MAINSQREPSTPGRYTVLRTVEPNGKHITDQPVAGRILATGDSYPEMLEVARRNRCNTWQKGDEVRVLTEQQTTGCAWTDEALFDWLHNAELLKLGSYAVVVNTANLAAYGPVAAPPRAGLVQCPNGCGQWVKAGAYIDPTLPCPA